MKNENSIYYIMQSLGTYSLQELYDLRNLYRRENNQVMVMEIQEEINHRIPPSPSEIFDKKRTD